jgi:hypothetical protein
MLSVVGGADKLAIRNGKGGEDEAGNKSANTSLYP